MSPSLLGGAGPPPPCPRVEGPAGGGAGNLSLKRPWDSPSRTLHRRASSLSCTTCVRHSTTETALWPLPGTAADTSLRPRWPTWEPPQTAWPASRPCCSGRDLRAGPLRSLVGWSDLCPHAQQGTHGPAHKPCREGEGVPFQLGPQGQNGREVGAAKPKTRAGGREREAAADHPEEPVSGPRAAARTSRGRLCVMQQGAQGRGRQEWVHPAQHPPVASLHTECHC